MSESLRYDRIGAPARVRTHTLFAQTMGYVAVTAALFALGAYLGRDLAYGAGIVAFIAAFACLIGMRFAARRSSQLTVGLLAAFGLLIGVAAGADPGLLRERGPECPMAGRRGHGAVHRRLRGSRLRHRA